MTEQEIVKEIFRIIEIDLIKRKTTRSQIRSSLDQLGELIKSLPEGKLKKDVLEKIKMKSRFAPYINDTGILDFTGYGEHFW